MSFIYMWQCLSCLLQNKGLVTQQAGCRGGQWSVPAAAAVCARGGNEFELYYVRLLHSPSNTRRADAADQSRSRRSADICVLGDRFARRAERNGGRIHRKINWKSAGVRILVRYRLSGLQQTCKKKLKLIFAQAFPLLIDFVHPPPFPISFTTQC